MSLARSRDKPKRKKNSTPSPPNPPPPPPPPQKKKLSPSPSHRYGHVKTLIDAAKKGVEAAGLEARVFRVPETLPQDVLTKMKAPPPDESVPVIAVDELPKADGFIFGFPTRFGNMPAQMKAFFDATGGLWSSGALAGRPAAMITSTASIGGGQETTIMASLPVLAHHGMIFVPAGYSLGPPLFALDKGARGGSPWGAGTLAGADGSAKPSQVELDMAELQGRTLAGVAAKLAAK